MAHTIVCVCSQLERLVAFTGSSRCGGIPAGRATLPRMTTPRQAPLPGPDEPLGHRVRLLTAADWPAVHDIYSAGIATGHATFETEPPSWLEFDSGRLPAHRLVCIDDGGSVTGWIAATAVSGRRVYSGVVEHSVYVRPDTAGTGVGRTLLRAFLASTETAGIWTVQSGVFPENGASLRLHAAMGFRVVGTRERIGLHHGTWRDVVLLERRSQAV
jgi:L-amino acid N-acyltransferase YncA